MATTLIGKVEKGQRYATGRIGRCRKVLEQRGLSFPPFRLGTVNIRLTAPYETPNFGYYIPQEEIDSVDRGHNEWWRLIPVSKINGKINLAYIYRTRTNFNGNDVAELIARDLGPAAALGETITLELMDSLDAPDEESLSSYGQDA